MTDAHDFDVPTIIGFGLIPMLALVFVLFKLLTSKGGMVAFMLSMGILAVCYCLGSAMMHSNLSWSAEAGKALGHGLHGLGQGIGKAAPWIGGSLLAAIVGWVGIEMAKHLPENAFIPIARILIPVAGFCAVAAFANTSNLIIIGVFGVVFGLIAAVFYLGYVVQQDQINRLEERYRDTAVSRIEDSSVDRGKLLSKPKNTLPAVKGKGGRWLI